MQKIYQYANSKTMLLSEIKVPKDFRNSQPNIDKVVYAESFYTTHSILDQPIILNHNGYIMDGYIRYLVAKAHNLETVPVIVIKAKIRETKSEPVTVTIKLSWRERLRGKLVTVI